MRPPLKFLGARWVVHPWRWLSRSYAGPIGSYSAWRKGRGAR
jgi:hypothetical protein